LSLFPSIVQDRRFRSNSAIFYHSRFMNYNTLKREKDSQSYGAIEMFGAFQSKSIHSEPEHFSISNFLHLNYYAKLLGIWFDWSRTDRTSRLDQNASVRELCSELRTEPRITKRGQNTDRAQQQNHRSQIELNATSPLSRQWPTLIADR
jgi:hypothetical protein